MGKGGQGNALEFKNKQQVFSWKEVSQHVERNDKWLVVNDQVYDVSQWQKKHPGGAKLLSHYAGQDATEAVHAFHNDLELVRKYMKSIHIGQIEPYRDARTSTLRQDYLDLRTTVERLGHFKPSTTFYVINIAHMLVLEVVAYLILSTCGITWIPFIASILCNAICQVQNSFFLHDFGHLSVFKQMWMNQYVSKSVAFIMGGSADFWNHMHYQHHAKPNVIGKDPDVRLEALFVVGDTMAKEMAEKKTIMPYNYQHRYFYATLPPLLFPVFFQLLVLRFIFLRRNWLELVLLLAYHIKFWCLYIPLLGYWTVPYYLAFRVIQSTWFVWISQSNHIANEINHDKNTTWIETQVSATCNVEKSFFNDWFTGHLNFQIEHHFFPTMPRHNLYKIAPLVKSLCLKHDLKYEVKPLGTAFADIIRSLESYGKTWKLYKEAYNMN